VCAADNFITSYLPHKYHLSMKLDSPANAASDFHEAAQQLQQQQQQQQQQQKSPPSNGQEASNGTSKAAANGAQPQGSSSSSSSRPLENETWWRLYCAGDVLACHLAQAMEQGLNLQVGGGGGGQGGRGGERVRNCACVWGGGVLQGPGSG
jgi:hypothetical protein